MSLTDDPTTAAIKDYILTEAAYTQAKAAYTSARSALLNLVPKEVGTFNVACPGFSVEIEYPEKVKWDEEKLDALYGGDKPAYLKMTYSIDMRALRRLPIGEQEQLSHCREILPGTPKINVETV